GLVAGPGEREDPPAFPPRQLGHEVRGRTEAVQAEPLRVPREAQRAIADQSRAEQRRELRVPGCGRQREAVPRVGDRLLGVAAVECVPGEQGLVAEVLAPRAAVAALAAGPAEPGDADSRAHCELVTLDDGADDL